MVVWGIIIFLVHTKHRKTISRQLWLPMEWSHTLCSPTSVENSTGFDLIVQVLGSVPAPRHLPTIPSHNNQTLMTLLASVSVVHHGLMWSTRSMVIH